MATATTAAIEAAGTRRAPKSEKFMEWQRELSRCRLTDGPVVNSLVGRFEPPKACGCVYIPFYSHALDFFSSLSSLEATSVDMDSASSPHARENVVDWTVASSRALHGGRKRHEETDMDAATGAKKTILKSDGVEDGSRPPSGEQESDERETDGGEPAEEVDASEGNGTGAAGHRTRKQKQLHQRQRSDVKKFRKEQEGIDPRPGGSHVQPASKEKSPPHSSSNNNNSNADGESARMRRCKQQQNAQEQQTSQSSSQTKRQQGAELLTPLPQTETSLSQPHGRRRQRRVPRSTSPPKEDKDGERVLRSLSRTRGGETPPPAPAVPPGKGTKRSKRVAQRLANEEPPPPPLKLPRLHLGLTRKEIQEDWLKITGHKYSGKPKKSTIVQRGLGLCTSLTCPSSIRYLNEPQCA